MPTPRADPLASSLSDLNHLTKLSSNTSTATTSSRDPTLVPSEYAASVSSEVDGGTDVDASSTQSKRGWFKKKKRTKSNAGSVGNATVGSGGTDGGRDRDEGDDVLNPLGRTVRDDEWRLGDDIRQHLDI